MGDMRLNYETSNHFKRNDMFNRTFEPNQGANHSLSPERYGIYIDLTYFTNVELLLKPRQSYASIISISAMKMLLK